MNLTRDEERLFELSKHLSGWSGDEGRRQGCVVADGTHRILSLGWNDLPKGVMDVSARRLRPAKYHWTEHAERAAIYAAGRNGVPLVGATLYLPWFPCSDCARAIVGAGISRVVGTEPDVHDGQWGAGFRVALEMMYEVCIEIWFVESEAGRYRMKPYVFSPEARE